MTAMFRTWCGLMQQAAALVNSLPGQQDQHEGGWPWFWLACCQLNSPDSHRTCS